MPNASCVKLHERVVVTETGGAVRLRFRSPCCKAWLSLEVLGSRRRITHARSRIQHGHWLCQSAQHIQRWCLSLLRVGTACGHAPAWKAEASWWVSMDLPTACGDHCGPVAVPQLWQFQFEGLWSLAVLRCGRRGHSRWSRPGGHEVIQIALGPLGSEWVLRRILF